MNKQVGLAFLLLVLIAWLSLVSLNATTSVKMKDFHSLQLTTLEGQTIDFSSFKGKKVLVVNTASECGLTPQLEALEQLHQKYGDKLVVIGVPTNDFGGQEPLEGEAIKSFCERNYGVSFLMLDKGNARGSDKHELLRWLTERRYNGKRSSRIWWNFQKYLVNEQGELVDYFLPITDPMSSRITRHLEN
jgi:glutathione peroxidase